MSKLFQLGGYVGAMTFLAACSVYIPPAAAELAQEPLCIADHPHTITVEIADTYDSRARGLMFRESLAEHAGMLFRYQDDRPSSAGFWMYNTYLPLDIAYIGADNRIKAIIAMDPCPSIDPKRCPSYQPGVSYRSALEMNQGYFAKYNIGIGREIVACPQNK
ncbi:DUF192 domain-containing protein [Pseudidiomarina taiwanensis]|nr:DUF192 domain-containing protein [Pseudidiomarina taiwanensis]